MEEAVLREVEQRVLWLATSIVQAANSRPEDGSGLKGGGHQASSASMVSVMTAVRDACRICVWGARCGV